MFARMLAETGNIFHLTELTETVAVVRDRTTAGDVVSDVISYRLRVAFLRRFAIISVGNVRHYR